MTLTLASSAQARYAPPSSYERYMTAAAKQFREQTYRTHPCMGRIVDRENGLWDPTLDYGGGHGNVWESYGLVQANPGTKMVSAGPLWRTDRATQLRWGIGYARTRFGSECSAWAYWQQHNYW